jgi:hypothetical protein
MFKPVAMTGGAGGTADAVVPAISDCLFQFPLDPVTTERVFVFRKKQIYLRSQNEAKRRGS